eukprot:gnl/MRDRNA2_/MRDRNA2_29203_c0_seq1.p1 gnl/MRDRNA2_/MRDRNA2_29203_c0~~gnl/MRDRNA2_/MRDRNA2_29203_c0_seq1.p1  ORF type:complete len:422 (+),score=164.75 gnl/MRDRNA2_/MRDRNA2_29203_c0_seq1:102-1367(+)
MQFLLLSLLIGAHGGRHSAPKDTELPAVSSMMNASAHTLGRISKHVENIGSHMSELIAAQKKELAQQKTKYEKQLQKEASENAALEAQNEKESASIWELEKSNDDLRAQAKNLQKENAKLRNAFMTVQAKVTAVTKFSKKALDATDDEGNADLAVLNQKEGESKDKDSDEESAQEGEEKKDETAESDAKDEDAAPAKEGDADQESKDDSTKDSDSDQDSDTANATATQDTDSSSDAQSFLAIRAKTTRTRRVRRDDGDADDTQDEDPAPAEEASSESSSDDDSQASQNTTDPEPQDSQSQQMVQELTKEITQLSQQQDNSRADLQKLFQARFKKGADKKAQILAKQELLNSTKASLTKLHVELEGAVKHLKVTKAKLENKLHGLGKYLAQLATYVTEPAADAEKALPSLPTDVQAFLQAKN